MFDWTKRLVGVGEISAEEKYANTWRGINEAQLATIEEGRLLANELSAASPKHRGGRVLPTAQLHAVGRNAAGLMVRIPVDEMLQDGFGTQRPCQLYLCYEFGNGNEHTILVAAAGRTLGKHGEHGMQRLFTEINTSER